MLLTLAHVSSGITLSVREKYVAGKINVTRQKLNEIEENINSEISRWKDYRADMLKHFNGGDGRIKQICEEQTIVKETFSSDRLSIENICLKNEESGRIVRSVWGGEIIELEIRAKILKEALGLRHCIAGMYPAGHGGQPGLCSCSLGCPHFS